MIKKSSTHYVGLSNEFAEFMDSKIPGYSKKGKEMRKISLSVDGIKIEGSIQKVKETLEKLNYPYYESESKGVLLIENMDSEHIRNSILKISKSLLELMRYEDMEKFVGRIKFNGLKGDDHKCLGWLCAELVRRHGLNQWDESLNEETQYPKYNGEPLYQDEIEDYHYSDSWSSEDMYDSPINF